MPQAIVSSNLTVDETYGLRAVIEADAAQNQTLKVYVDEDQDGDYEPNELKLTSTSINAHWDGGHVGVYVNSIEGGSLPAIDFDDFKCGIDMNGDWDADDAADYACADYDFNSPAITFTHDDNGNLTDDGRFQYKYDAWNRLVGVWYNDGDMDDANEVVARYEYDGLYRRIEKEVTGNQGVGIVHGSDNDRSGILAGQRHEHYFYSGWRLVETTRNRRLSRTPLSYAMLVSH